jgi:hypothetical protein
MLDAQNTPKSFNTQGKDKENTKENKTQNSNILPLDDPFFNGIEDEILTPDDQLLEEAKIDPSEELTPPPVCWQLIHEDGSNATLGTLGNFSLVIGKAKSRKSFLMCLAVSATTKNDIIQSRFRGCLPLDQPHILYFDTEQSRFHALRALKRVCALIGIPTPSNLSFYSLRKFPPAKRLDLIERVIYSNSQIGFVVIDGIKDLINSINDEAEATMLSSKLLKWTEERNIHIVCVLHQNKGDNNARGHIGTELMHKAETVLSVTKSTDNKDISIVEAEYCRDKDPEPFAFEIDSDGLPVIDQGWLKKLKKNSKKQGIEDLTLDQLNTLIIQSFIKISELSYSELKTQIKVIFNQRFGFSIGDNKSKDIILICKNEGLIIQDNPKGKYKRKVEDSA